MTHEVAKVTHQETALASSGIKWEENITVKRWGMGIFWAWLYNKSVAKDYNSMKLVPNKKGKHISHNSMFKLGKAYEPRECNFKSYF